ncbi:MAG: serine hydrolase [Patescibacteria group bacterium]
MYRYRKLIGAIIFAAFFMILGKNLDFVPRVSLPGQTPVNTESLKKQVLEFSKKQKGSYSVYYKSLSRNSSFGISENQVETGASVNKLPLVAAVYYLDKEGKIRLDDKITIQEEDVQDYGTGSIRYQKMPQVYSIRNLVKLAVRESDNTAAHVLAVKIGLDKTQELIDSWGLTQTNMANNKTTNSDMELLFEKIYKGGVTNPANTEELLSFLTDSDTEDRLPAKLPKGVKVYHKTGDEEGFVHDLGIIETKKGAYFLGVMTSDIGEAEEATKKAIAEISKMVYEFEENL